jgi:hypothetical protein
MMMMMTIMMMMMMMIMMMIITIKKMDTWQSCVYLCASWKVVYEVFAFI